MSSSANTPGESQQINNFYDAAPLEPHLLYQGEILTNVPFLSMPRPSRWLLLRTRSGKRLDEALRYGATGGTVNVLDSNMSAEQWNADNRGDFAVAILDKNPVLVLNQTCDIESNDFIQIAPIFRAEGDAAHIERLIRGEIYSAFWLQTHPPHISEQSYADLELIQAVHKSYVRRVRTGEHFRLSPERVRSLQRTVTRYFGRPNSFDSRSDIVPRTGTYLCVSCFYLDGRVTSAVLNEGERFHTCTTCSGTSWVLRGR